MKYILCNIYSAIYILGDNVDIINKRIYKSVTLVGGGVFFYYQRVFATMSLSGLTTLAMVLLLLVNI